MFKFGSRCFFSNLIVHLFKFLPDYSKFLWGRGCSFEFSSSCRISIIPKNNETIHENFHGHSFSYFNETPQLKNARTSVRTGDKEERGVGPESGNNLKRRSSTR